MVMPGCARLAATAYRWWRAPAMICSVASCRSGHTCWRKNSTARTLGRYEGSKSRAKAEAAGLTVLTTGEAAKAADVVMILVADHIQGDLYRSEERRVG